MIPCQANAARRTLGRPDLLSKGPPARRPVLPHASIRASPYSACSVG